MKKKRWVAGLLTLFLCVCALKPVYAETTAPQIAPSGISKDSKKNMYLADRNHHVLYQRTRSGTYTVLAGKNGQSGYKDGSAKGVEGDAVGSAKKARFSNPQDIILYQNDIYISDTGNGSVKKLSGGKVTMVVKAFSLLENQAPAEPCGLTIQGGYLYVGDTFVEKLLKIKR